MKIKYSLIIGLMNKLKCKIWNSIVYVNDFSNVRCEW